MTTLWTPKLSRYNAATLTTRQRVFLALPHLEAFYGGAAGGGKSFALLQGALQNVDVPGYNAILFRRTLVEHEQAEGLIPLSHELLADTDAHWNGQLRQWQFPAGTTIRFGYMAAPNDMYRYQGGAYQYVGWDELAHFLEKQYRYLLSRVRRRKGDMAQIPLRFRAAGNPDGPGFTWVRSRFVIPGDPGRPYVPARMEDNPYLDVDPYRAALALLDPVTEAKLAEGDWSITQKGDMFDRTKAPRVDPTEIPDGLVRVRYWDFAATDPDKATKRKGDPDWTVGLLLGADESNVTPYRYYVLDVQRFRKNPADTEQRVRQQARLDGVDVPIRLEQEPGASGVTALDHYRNQVLPEFDVDGRLPSGDKSTRARPISGHWLRSNVAVVVADWNEPFFDELEPFPTEGVHDDQVDALSGAHSWVHEVSGYGAY